MTIEHKVKLCNFSVPYEVQMQGKLSEKTVTFSLSDLSFETLNELCIQFRKDVFKQANVRDA